MGSTVVSIGFVDMGFLREATFAPAKDPTATAPLHWVGFEASAYCVAKTAVIASMMEIGEEVDSLLQVWFSAGWMKATLQAFRRGLSRLLSGDSKILEATHPDVEALLLHWQSCGTVSLATARSGWLEKSTDLTYWRLIGNFKDSNDRMALCSYSLTGQLLDADVGSVVMFSLPYGYMGKLTRNESVFTTISLRNLMNERQSSTDVVEAVAKYLRKGIQKISILIKDGLLLVDVRLQAVEPSNKAVIASISAMNPYNISWSNVPDYFEPRDFHEMASACSGASTLHHSYSMNWPRAVYGASVADYYLPSSINGLTDISFLNGTVNRIATLMQPVYTSIGASKLLLLPPIDDSRNIVDSMMFVHYRRYWKEAFFSYAVMRDVEKQVHEVGFPFYNIFSRTNSSVFYTFTYDPELAMTGTDTSGF
jgi:hypothetical protein